MAELTVSQRLAMLRIVRDELAARRKMQDIQTFAEWQADRAGREYCVLLDQWKASGLARPLPRFHLRGSSL